MGKLNLYWLVKEFYGVLSLFAGVWIIWLERNNRVFRYRSFEVVEITDSIVWMVSGWASHDKVFVDVTLHDLYISWEACFQRIRQEQQSGLPLCGIPW